MKLLNLALCAAIGVGSLYATDRLGDHHGPRERPDRGRGRKRS